MALDGATPDAAAARPLADALAAPLVGAYRAGGFGLAFLLLGATVLTAAGFAGREPVTYVLLGVGAVLVLVPCYWKLKASIAAFLAARKELADDAESPQPA